MKDIVILEKKKRSLLSRIFGLKEQVQKQTEELTHRTEIENLVLAVRSVDEEIFDAMVSEARAKVAELEEEAVKLVEEKTGLQKRTEEIDQRLVEIFGAVSAIIPKKRKQVSSKRTVKMIREVTEAEFVGMFKSSELEYEAGVPVGHKFAPSYDIRKKVVSVQVPQVPQSIEHARSLGYELAEGERLEEEALDDQNSVMINCFPMPEVLR